MKKEKTKSDYALNIEKAKEEINKKNYEEDKKYIMFAFEENQKSPEVHNLLGIIAELNKDISSAGKHYRASYALDPTFKPSSVNLERITSFYYGTILSEPDYGDKISKEKSTYILEYDNDNVGHLTKLAI